MIYSQTPLHNGLVRVSIKAEGDSVMLTFFDTQWSVALSVSPSYCMSLHLFFHISLKQSYRGTHVSSFHSSSSSFLSSTLSTHQRFPVDILSVSVAVWIFNSRRDMQHHNIGRQNFFRVHIFCLKTQCETLRLLAVCDCFCN